MVFTSPLFLFLFLPLFFLGYYGLPAKGRITWILLGSWIFYGFWRWDFLLLLVFVSLFNWLAGLLLDRLVDTPPRTFEPPRHGSKNPEVRTNRTRKALIAIVIAVNLGILGYFKYTNFGVDAFNRLLAALGLGSLTMAWVILPVGISFYIFQAMSYSIDVYRGDAPVARSFISLAAYIALFPQLIAGPIVRYKDLADQLLEPHISWGRINRGIYRFLFGLAKKILLADTLGLVVDRVFDLPSLVVTDSWFGILAYSLQLYLDFSAYSDMAIGLGLMLGFRFLENFRQPYLARSVTEFWQRWHISLSTWLRDYLYIPLGGNRRGSGRTMVNLILVMVLGGFWHGASWNFILWGAWHGLLLLMEREKPEIYLTSFTSSKAVGERTEDWKELVLRIRLFLAITIGWVLFRAETLEKALAFLGSMVGNFGVVGSGGALFSSPVGVLIQPFTLVIFVASILFTLFEPNILWFLGLPGSHGVVATSRPMVHGLRWMVVLGFTGLSLMKLMADSFSPFLYFQF
jgi:alginate O-acetyltransferase complex protein AlgI